MSTLTNEVAQTIVEGTGRGSKPVGKGGWTTVAKFHDEGDELVEIKKRGRRLSVTRGETLMESLSAPCAKIIGEKIRRRRRELGMSARELGDAVKLGGTSATSTTRKQAVISLEKANRGHGPNVGTLIAIAMALECEVHDLMPSVGELSTLTGITKSGPQLVRTSETMNGATA